MKLLLLKIAAVASIMLITVSGCGQHNIKISGTLTNMLFAAPVRVPVKGIYPSVLLTEKLENNSQLQFTFTNRISKPPKASKFHNGFFRPDKLQQG